MRTALLPQQIQLKHNDITIIDPENIFKPVFWSFIFQKRWFLQPYESQFVLKPIGQFRNV
jgi:hypothetical protein